jgi:hypothetical protein
MFRFFKHWASKLLSRLLKIFSRGNPQPKGEPVMSALSIQPTYPIFTDIDGQPLEDGFVWVGVTNLDPQGNPIAVFWDAALTIPAVQPIRTLAGYPSRNGSPARLYVDNNYSIRVMNKNGSVVYSAPAATERYGGIITSADISFIQDGAQAVLRTAQSKMRETVSAMDFGAACDWDGSAGTDDTSAIQAAIDYCIANQKDLLIPGLSLITASLNIDRLVDSSAADNYFTIASVSGGGIVVNSAIAMFSTTLVNSSNPNLPVSQMIRFSGLKFESTDSSLAAYVLDQNKLLRVLLESCNFRKIKCLNAPAGKLTQTITFQNCQARRWTGTFFKSDEVTFDLKVIGGLWEAGGDAFDIDFPVGSAFIGANIEGMSSFAIKYTGGYGLTVQGCYFEQNGDNDPNGCSIDGSAGIGGAGSENVLIAGCMFSGDTDTPSKPQVKWGDTTIASSMANQCTTTLHNFTTGSRVSVYGDYARTALSNTEPVQILHALSNQSYGGALTQEFVGGHGGLLKLRSIQNNVLSTRGITVDENGNAGFGIDNSRADIQVFNGNARPKLLMSDGTLGPTYGGFFSGWGITAVGGYAAIGTMQGGSTSEAVLINPAHDFHPNIDNTQKLGVASFRWSEVYAGNGTINTSDARAKQQVRDLTAAEKAVAAKCKSLIKAFKFNDAVESKGENARIHFGVLAQDVKAAFESEGLDANKYGLFCYDQWDDLYAPVSETVDVVGENGCVTKVSRYTGEQKLVRPAGSRYGIRYEQLLAFIISSI